MTFSGLSWAGLGLGVLGIAVGLFVAMSVAWLVWRRTGNSGWIDVCWTFGTGLVGAAASLAPLSAEAEPARQGLVALLIAVWALRLGLHIARRTTGISDDPRYAELIRGYGADANRQMFFLAQKQAIVTLPLVASIMLAAQAPRVGLGVQDLLGALALAIAILGEALADRQLRGFTRDRARPGRVCDVGLWRWSRHPNYFFQWFGWLAYPLIAIEPGYAFGWLALIGPACMYWLLVYVSGIPPLEAHMIESRGAAYRAYQQRTSAFFPLPPQNAT